jgi:hypothetical protein
MLVDKLHFQRKIETVDLTKTKIVVDTLEEAKIQCLTEEKVERSKEKNKNQKLDLCKHTS